MPHPPIAVHEIGRGEEIKIKDTINSFTEVAQDIARIKPETIIITSPHSIMYRDYFHISPREGARGDFGNFRASHVKFDVKYDVDLVAAISDIAAEENFPAGCDGERDPHLDHGTMVPLYFINKEYADAKIIRIGLSGLSLKAHWQFGRLIDKAVNKLNRKCVFVASGDLSHCQKKDGPYGFKAEGPMYDERIMEVMGSGNFAALEDFEEVFLDKAQECGHRSFTIMGGALEGKNITTKQLSHEATFGVGYGFCMYHVK